MLPGVVYRKVAEKRERSHLEKKKEESRVVNLTALEYVNIVGSQQVISVSY